jgi:hypothetical protein
MKKRLLVPTILLMASCAQNKNISVTNSPVSQTENTIQIKTIEGEVLEITQGKDGYTAKINTLKNESYFITISRANLKDPTEYKTINIGQEIKVTGDFWKMENENHITVREIL